MFPIESFQKTVLKIASILIHMEIPFHLTGGVTGVAYGEPRLTQDIDIVIQNEAVSSQQVEFLNRLAESDFLHAVDSIRVAIENKKMFQLFDREESLKIDIYPREMITGELSRSESAEIFEGYRLPIVCRTDAAASKLVWISKGSQKSRRDLRQIYHRLDAAQKKTLSLMAAELDLEQLLVEVIAESDEIDF
jgi:hypothetical protein